MFNFDKNGIIDEFYFDTNDFITIKKLCPIKTQFLFKS